MIRPVVLASSLLILALICAGCITAPQEDNSATQGENYPGSTGSLSGKPHSNAPVPSVTPVAGSSWDPAVDQKIIKTSYITIEVPNVTTAIDQLKTVVTAHGGYIGSMTVNSRDGNRLYAVMTMRVPAREFDAAVAGVKPLGTLKSESLSAEDVTEEYVDLQAERSAYANQLAQYNRIMERAVNVSEVLAVQVQIERVQVELDRIDGRMKYLDNRVDYGTITVTLEEPQPVGGGGGISCISVINESIAGFLAVAAGLVIILVSIIPLIIVGAIATAIYRWWKGRKNMAKTEQGEKKEGGNPPGR